MTDLQRFTELYKSLGIECKVYIESEFQHIRLADDYMPPDNPTLSNKFQGYTGFYTEIIFDLEGKFMSQGFWE